MAFSDKIYSLLPLPLQNVAISIFGFLWQKRRFGGIFKAKLIEFKSREKYTEPEWKEYQTKELRSILKSAFQFVPFYNIKYSQAGFKLSDFDNFELEDLKRLPFLEKDELRVHGKTSLLSNKLDPDGSFFSSSGSTGKPVSVYLSKKTHQVWTAGYEARVKNWAGVTMKMVRGMIGGRRILPDADAKRPFYRYNFFEKMVYFSAYHINAHNSANYVEGLKSKKVDFIMGYAMSNFFLARFINLNNLQAPKLKAVITSSEKLTKEMREEFKKAYGCESFDTWSGVEACAQISECECHSLHESPDIGIIEVIGIDGKEVSNGNAGEAVCTSLINFDQPLIRYRCGDVLKKSKKDCICGRNMNVYSEIVGRIEDVVIGEDGREMVRFHGIFVNISSIIEGQIIQHKLLDFEIKIVVSNHLTYEELELIEKRMRSQLGDKIKVNIVEVNKIEKGPNGKFKAVISHIKK